MRLSLTPNLRQYQECSVCLQEMDTDGGNARVCAQLFGAKALAVCPCCGQEADPSDRNYTRRARLWIRKVKGEL